MRVLVLGGDGFIGRHVVRALRGDGHEALSAEVHTDWLDRPFDYAIHLAAMGGVALASKHPGSVIGNNVRVSATLRAQAEKYGYPVLLVSSFSVYGLAYPVTIDTPPNPLEAYGASKYMQELCFRGSKVPHSIVRLSSVYGRDMAPDGPTIIAKIAQWIRADERPQLNEDGLQTRDWVSVVDVVDAIVAVMRSGRPLPLLNVCSGVPTTLLEACQVMARAMGKDEPRIDYTGRARPGDMRHCLGDAEPLARLLGRKPVTFREGICAAFSSP